MRLSDRYKTPIWLRALIAASLFAALDMALSWSARTGFVRAYGQGILVKLGLAALDWAILFILFLPVFALLGTGKRAGRALGWSLLGIFVGAYGLSWAVFRNINIFLNVDGWVFFLSDLNQILLQILQVSTLKLAIIFVLGALAPIAVPVALVWSVERMAAFVHRRDISRDVCLAFLSIALACAAAVPVFLLKDIAVARLFRDNLSPQAALTYDLFMPFQPSQALISVEGGGLSFKWHRQMPFNELIKAQDIAGIKTVPVIMIVVESFRDDALDDPAVMPNLHALKEGALYWRSSLTPANSTGYAWPSALSSLYPLRFQMRYYYPPRIRHPKVFIYDLLKQYGYRTGIFSAQNEEWGRMKRHLMTPNLDIFQDALSEKDRHYISALDINFMQWVQSRATAGKLDDGVVIDKAINWVKQAPGKPFFVAINMQRTHFPYTWPDGFAPRYLPVDLDFDLAFTHYPVDKVPVMKNRYKNALAYVDLQIGRLVAFLKEAGLYEQSLIVVTGDHGEAFYEKEFSGHGNSLYRQEALVPLVIKAPGQAFKGERPGMAQNIDIAPTICHILGIPPHPAFQGDDLLGDLPEDRPLFIISQGPRGDQAAVISGDWKLIQDYRNQREILFNLSQDPQETADVLAENRKTAGRLRAKISAWRRAQLAYYADIKTYTRFYPPKVVVDTGKQAP